MDGMQGPKMRHEWIPVTVRTQPQQIRLWDPGIQMADRILHYVMSRNMAEGDLVHLGFGRWGIDEPSIVWRGSFIMLLFRTEIDSGWVDIDIMDMPRQDEFGLQIFFAIRFQERRI